MHKANIMQTKQDMFGHKYVYTNTNTHAITINEKEVCISKREGWVCGRGFRARREGINKLHSIKFN